MNKGTLISLGLVFGAMQLLAQAPTKYIVVDQFGYLPEGKKVAVIRDPQTGFDASEVFAPGNQYALVNSQTGERVATKAPVPWNGGATHATSGDRAWIFDFSEITTIGRYYVLDVTQNVRSFEFQVSPSVYAEVLKHAVRTFYYQRAGMAKSPPFADPAWADGASHIGPGQDTEARWQASPTDAARIRDVSGGWYDAGDYNKYTNWTANYVVELIKAWQERPQAFGDDYNIPESGNGIPDILDEVRWGLEHLLRMQEEDGSVLSIVGMSHASPPSAATGVSRYGSASTSATLNTAAALALAAKVWQDKDGAFATQLQVAALAGWAWAEANPSVLFYNNSSEHGTSGLGAGQQEVDDYGRLMAKLEAAVYLLELTGEERFQIFFDENYHQAHLIEWSFVYPFEHVNQEILLHYSTLANATPAVRDRIRSVYAAGILSNDNLGAVRTQRDPYQAYLKDYTWGSNGVMAAQALMYLDLAVYSVDTESESELLQAAAGYVNYLHGLNPLNLVYLSNMYAFGAENSVNEFYHSWFANGSSKWDRVGVSTHGPAPGFLTGGPNPSYNWDGCCPSNCGSAQSNAVCNSESITPPKGQPAMKSYKDFNTSWPLNSWEVTENSNGYQVNYIRLLSKFVDASIDCAGERNGTATLDVCGNCAGGNSGITPVTDPSKCNPLSISGALEIGVFPNPTQGQVWIGASNESETFSLSVFNTAGSLVLQCVIAGGESISLADEPSGLYLLKIQNSNGMVQHFKLIKTQPN